MQTLDESKRRDEVSPLDLAPENVDESNLKNTLEILVASGKISREDVMNAWELAFTA